jgi:hypothetical protein
MVISDKSTHRVLKLKKKGLLLSEGREDKENQG